MEEHTSLIELVIVVRNDHSGEVAKENGDLRPDQERIEIHLSLQQVHCDVHNRKQAVAFNSVGMERSRGRGKVSTVLKEVVVEDGQPKRSVSTSHNIEAIDGEQVGSRGKGQALSSLFMEKSQSISQDSTSRGTDGASENYDNIRLPDVGGVEVKVIENGLINTPRADSMSGTDVSQDAGDKHGDMAQECRLEELVSEVKREVEYDPPRRNQRRKSRAAHHPRWNLTEEEASDGGTTELHQSNREKDLKPALGGLEFTAVSQAAKQRSCEIKDAEVNAQDSHIQSLKPLIVIVDIVSDIVVVVVEVQRSQKEECIPQNDTSSRHSLSLSKLKKMKFNNLMIVAKVATQ